MRAGSRRVRNTAALLQSDESTIKSSEYLTVGRGGDERAARGSAAEQ